MTRLTRQWATPTLLTTLYPTGDPIVLAWSGSTGTRTCGDSGGGALELSASLRDGDPATYGWVKSVNTGGYGTQTIRRVNWVFETCPEYARVAHLVIRLSVKMIRVGNLASGKFDYVGVELSGGQPGNPQFIAPVNGADFAWQEYQFANDVGGVPWTPARVNAQTFGTDCDQFLASGDPTNNVEYRIAEIELQVWGNA